jgi:hypothetical protein
VTPVSEPALSKAGGDDGFAASGVPVKLYRFVKFHVEKIEGESL